MEILKYDHRVLLQIWGCELEERSQKLNLINLNWKCEKIRQWKIHGAQNVWECLSYQDFYNVQIPENNWGEK